jgi:hypothetical protein
MIRSMARLLLLVATFLVVVHSATADASRVPQPASLETLRAAIFAPPAQGQAPQGGQWLAACTVTLRCPNGEVLTCPSTPCHHLNNCEIVCNGEIVTCSGVCTIQ